MIWPMHTSKCTSTIETAVYENRTYGGVRGRRLVTASYSIGNGFTETWLSLKTRIQDSNANDFIVTTAKPASLAITIMAIQWPEGPFVIVINLILGVSTMKWL